MSSDFERDLDYLRAELAQCQQLGVGSTQIRTTELQRLLDKLREYSKRPAQPVKVAGFARPGELFGLKRGSITTIRIKGKQYLNYTQPVYFDPPDYPRSVPT
jgi:hypothetical protein